MRFDSCWRSGALGSGFTLRVRFFDGVVELGVHFDAHARNVAECIHDAFAFLHFERDFRLHQ